VDGVPGLTQAAVESGASFDYRFKAPDAGTFWYHAPVSADGKRLHGPKGALIVADTEPAAVDREEILLIDRTPEPDDPIRDLAVRAHERLRMRLINATEALLAIRLDRHQALVVAIDGQPAEPFTAREARLFLAPGNRIDVVVDMALGSGTTAPILATQTDRDIPLARFVYEVGPPVRSQPLAPPRALPAAALPEKLDFRNAQRVDVPVGLPLQDAAKTKLFGARRGRTVMLALVNRSATPRVVHLHGHSARLLDSLDDGWKPFWLDTILVPAQQTSRIAFVADNPGKWLLEFRPLGQAESAVAWFEVG
jgi:FtsP/CotA-like multicopper oxidase with cupredoxin domain